MKTYPRIRVRRNAAGKYDAYLVKAAWSPEIWLATGPTIAGALWWLPAASVSRCCLVGA